MDIVIERGAGGVAGIEVKASSTVTASDFCGLRKLKAAAGKRFAGGFPKCHDLSYLLTLLGLVNW